MVDSYAFLKDTKNLSGAKHIQTEFKTRSRLLDEILCCILL